ncbi:MAG: ABC transporter permease, partial [Bacteroidota bacterium]|nr:ABC transporter permease [Bacteroidota bacterium]
MRSIGKYFIFLGHLFTNRESFKTYFRLILDESVLIGVNSILIVVIVSTFIGAVTAVQTAWNLVSPLISNYVIGMIVRDMTVLELAPTITAIVFAGKVGSNIAGGLGTMRITEQIDALEVMGINATSYLVLPKIVASMIVYPMLVILACFLSIYGGYLAGTLSGVITGEEFIYGIRIDFKAFTIAFMIIKSIVFAFLVASISSYKGFY